MGGIVNLEGAFHHSFDDNAGDDPLVPNSNAQGLLGFDRELVTNLNLGLQYYLVYTLEHEAMLERLGAPAAGEPDRTPDELRHTVTLRLTLRALRDDLTFSLFAMGSPSDEDLYLRPTVTYRVSEAVELAIGANVMLGSDEHTFIGQLQDNSNAFGRVRYAF
jgi:hypothetical protein